MPLQTAISRDEAAKMRVGIVRTDVERGSRKRSAALISELQQQQQQQQQLMIYSKLKHPTGTR